MKILSVTAQKPNSTGSGVYLTELMKEFEKLGHKQAIVAGISMGEEIALPCTIYEQGFALPCLRNE